MIQLKVSKHLLSYDSPLVVVATDKENREYVGVNYDDSDEGYKFYFVRARSPMMQDFFNGNCDLLYLITRKRVGDFRSGNSWGVVGEQIETQPLRSIREDFLPEPGVFIPQSEREPSTSMKEVHIDGRWGISDLRKFSDRVQDCYAFVFALKGRGHQATQQKTVELFRKYPWKGGFSSVNFFNELYALIPATEKAVIKEIRYASPGKIELCMDTRAAESIRSLVLAINDGSSSAPDAYKEIHDWLRVQGWLGQSSKDVVLHADDKADLKNRVSQLTSVLDLHNQEDRVLSLSRADPLGGVKILLAYYRRLAALADYVATGKASELFV